MDHPQSLEQRYSLFWVLPLLGVLLSIDTLVVLGAGGGLAQLGWAVLISLLSVLIAWWIAVHFVQAFYQVETSDAAAGFLFRRVFGQLSMRPFIVVKGGQITLGDALVEKIGGPATLIVYADSAVVLEQAGRLTRVLRGPETLKLKPFERVWDTLDLRPQNWPFEVNARTKDGIPIKYEANIQFQLEAEDEAILKAARQKWIRDANRTEPDRLMIWTKRVIISNTEGGFRAILARYELDELLDFATRAEIRQKLLDRLIGAVKGLGTKIIDVQLGDIRLEDQILEQWIDTWRAERRKVMSAEVVSDGTAKRAQMLEKARGEVRGDIYQKTRTIFDELHDHGEEQPEQAVILSFIEVIGKIAPRLLITRPIDIFTLTDEVGGRIEPPAKKTN
ncbi:MAG: SPFH domain-containing protein [Chloroflexota bacterium]|nr:SPFH domain-containing protein [Chloroflexota bacterium]